MAGMDCRSVFVKTGDMMFDEMKRLRVPGMECPSVPEEKEEEGTPSWGSRRAASAAGRTR